MFQMFSSNALWVHPLLVNWQSIFFQYLFYFSMLYILYEILFDINYQSIVLDFFVLSND